jgi:anti-sigma factor RsiW
MTCDLWQDKIDAFVDSELTAVQAQAFEDHLRTCPACSAETLARQRLKFETHLAGRRFTPSAEFEARIRKKFGPPHNRSRWFLALSFAGAAAVVVVAIFAGIALRQNVLKRQLVAQLVDQHVATLASSNPVDVISTDAHTVKPWFSGKVPFSVDLPQLSGTEFSLIGGRVAYFQQEPAAQLVFGIRKHRISVFIFRDHGDTSLLGSEDSPVKRMGFQTQSWVEDGIRYVAVSDVNAPDLHRLCELLKQASGS